jgi:glycerophosphoryl diester phosphodiesterase
MRKIVILNKIGLLKFHGNFNADTAQVPEYDNKTKIITKSLIKNLHKKGVKVHVWTVNKKSEMLRFYNMGVDAIITDNPRLLLKTVNEIEKIRK